MERDFKKATWRHYLGLAIALIAPIAIPLNCSRHLDDCEGAALNLSQLASLKRNLQSTGAGAFLVLPSPIKNTAGVSTQASTSSSLFSLSNQVDPSRLESDYIKIRIKAITDDLSTLAKADSSGSFKFNISDIHYSEVMAYFGTTALVRYSEALGFKTRDSRQLFVNVRDKSGDDGDEVNAYYEHNYLDSKMPRVIRMIGGKNTNYHVAIEQDISIHETGHNRNELISAEVGFDYAGDNGGNTQGSALHECLADYQSESLRQDPDIGPWTALNFQEYPAGQPLRTAIQRAGRTLSYREVAEFDGTDKNLDRYRLGEWCTRVLWQLREQFVKEDPQNGQYLADRMVLGALTFLKKDSGLSDFRAALEKSDDSLHCGLHNRSINQAFELNGHSKEVGDTGSPLQVTGTAVGINDQGKVVPASQATQILFDSKIINGTGQTARNVRMYLESSSPALIKISYMQGYGDLPPSGTINVGENGLSNYFGVTAVIDRKAVSGGTIPFTLRVVFENGPESTYQGNIQL